MPKVLMSEQERDAAGLVMDPVDDRFGVAWPASAVPQEDGRWYVSDSTLYIERLDQYAFKAPN